MSDPQSNRSFVTIAITRVLCIFGIIYVHAWTGRTGDELSALAQSGQGIFRWMLIELLGRSAVPLLGMISGWLVAGSTKIRSYPGFVAAKARTILLPMLLWNALSILLVSGAAYIWGLKAPTPSSLSWLVDELLCLTRPNDINVQTPFLRDLFLCMVVAPLLLRLSGAGLIAVGCAVAIWAVAGWVSPMLLRPQILLFFIAGILVRRGRLADRLGLLPFSAVILPFGLIVPVKIWLSIWGSRIGMEHAHVLAAVDILMRFSAALLVWRMAWHLAGTTAAGPLRRIEPYAFFIFCSHLILIWLAAPMLDKFIGPLGSPAYPLLLLLQPLLIAIMAIPFARMLLAWSPGAANLLSGGRLTARIPVQRYWQPA